MAYQTQNNQLAMRQHPTHAGKQQSVLQKRKQVQVIKA